MRGQIAEQDLAQVRIGQPATVYLTGLPRPSPARCACSARSSIRPTRLGEIRITLSPDPALRPGRFCTRPR